MRVETTGCSAPANGGAVGLVRQRHGSSRGNSGQVAVMAWSVLRAQPLLQGVEGGVVGDDVDVAGREAVQGGEWVGFGVVFEVGVAESDSDVGGVVSAGRDRAASQGGEVDVPEPGGVASVGLAGVDRDDQWA